MKREELNEKLAVEVMGWDASHEFMYQSVKDNCSGMVFDHGLKHWIYPKFCWNPTENLTQLHSLYKELSWDCQEEYDRISNSCGGNLFDDTFTHAESILRAKQFVF